MKTVYDDLEPQEIFVDTSPSKLGTTFLSESKMERPLTRFAFSSVLLLGGLVSLLYIGQTLHLSIYKNEFYVAKADQNRLSSSLVLAERGAIVDRNGKTLAKNISTTSADGTIRTDRTYPFLESAAHLVGYVSYPKRDKSGNYYQTQIEGLSGVERLYNSTLVGVNGTQLIETNATGTTTSGKIIKMPVPGPELKLSIDAELQEEMYKQLKVRVNEHYKGGAAAVMDINTGELLSLVSYPSYDPEIMSRGEPASVVSSYMNDPRSPFVDRAVVGLYAPGSIVKPFVAVAVLEEDVVSPSKSFYSSGKLVVPNPYNPDKPSVFKDWKAHGTVDMRRAIAVSSDVYFYIVGGGFEDQKGLGITALNTYMKKFGFGEHTGFPDDAEPLGVVPNPQWKADSFEQDDWRLGDTYISSIGQFGWQVTLLQSLRATAALANDGILVTPSILKTNVVAGTKVDVEKEKLAVAREGMRMAVTEGTAQAMSIPNLKVAGKTGTAEVGVRKEFMNSLVIGFFPYDKPKYAFAVVLEQAKAGTNIGAPAVMGEVLRWVAAHKPELGSTE